MVNAEAMAWAQEVLGESGPYVRERVPALLAATHDRYVALQGASGLADASPYGLMWLGVPQALTDAFQDVAGVQRFRPKRGRYYLPLVNGVPIIPWRYAKDGTTDLRTVPFGQPLTETRKALFAPSDLHPELPLGDVGLGDAIVEALTVEQRDLVNSYGADIRALAIEGLVAVLAFASNSDALLNGYFGYATLGSDGLLIWTYIEELQFTSPDTALREVPLQGDRPTFDSGPLEQPKLRPRKKLEEQQGDETNPTGTHE